MDKLLANLNKKISEAVRSYWLTREGQTKRQKEAGRVDQGARSAVTGGAQMDGFISLITEILCNAGIDSRHIFRKTCIELPGFFRPTKEWDLLVVKDGQLIVALEAKSQVGPSFGNNFNNRTEEAVMPQLRRGVQCTCHPRETCPREIGERGSIIKPGLLLSQE